MIVVSARNGQNAIKNANHKQTTYNFTSNLRGKSKTAKYQIRMIDKTRVTAIK